MEVKFVSAIDHRPAMVCRGSSCLFGYPMPLDTTCMTFKQNQWVFCTGMFVAGLTFCSVLYVIAYFALKPWLTRRGLKPIDVEVGTYCDSSRNHRLSDSVSRMLPFGLSVSYTHYGSLCRLRTPLLLSRCQRRLLHISRARPSLFQRRWDISLSIPSLFCTIRIAKVPMKWEVFRVS